MKSLLLAGYFIGIGYLLAKADYDDELMALAERGLEAVVDKVTARVLEVRAARAQALEDARRPAAALAGNMAG